ncbi:Putative serine protease HtrA [Anatilimnocola aggregata]|uniref:Serine protease HtrA n=1 Tax=Anatilimnocola aggregata TaxID=2528021 RepID=A0A517YHI1_9BACT|nr:trypsin-like peptidase domain-containing protein [Anatilimnocola aggregata]QDU29673.1 Putative serine protease HtrA [Anatilimnocola aggregata]
MSDRISYQQISGPSNPGDGRERAPGAVPSESDLLDAYSQAVVNVVEKVSPAVISVTGEGGGSGSGFIIKADGYAITNSHVVGGRQKLIAQTDDGDRLDAKVVGDDPATDIAVLRLAASDLPSAELADSDAVRVGQLVIAMGSPMGLHSTVSTGIISATGRTLRGNDGRLIESIIQHTAPINPGNSGGPLVDSRGRVVGVNTAIIALAQGLGFAVSGKTAEWVASEILAYGRVRRRQLGVTAAVERLPKALVREFDLLSDQIVRVIEVMPRGVAQRSGIRSDDIIVAINDRLVTSVDDIHRLLTSIPHATSLVMTLLRGRTKLEVEVAWQS